MNSGVSPFEQLTKLVKEFYSAYSKLQDNDQGTMQKSDELNQIQQLICSFNFQHFDIQQYIIKCFHPNQINYIQLFEDPENQFSLGIFFFGEGASMPLHDHPNMFVLSQSLIGNLRIQSMDLKDPSIQISHPLKVLQTKNIDKKVSVTVDAQFTDDLLLKENDILTLYPQQNNLHRFFADQNCALLDLLLPNYDNDQKRFCNFYDLIENQKFQQNQFTKLKILYGFPDEYDIDVVEVDKTKFPFFTSYIQ